MKIQKLSGLFSKAVLALVVISFVPVFIVGFHVMGVDSRILKNEILQKQQTVAGRLLSVVRSHLTRQAQLFSIFIDLHSEFGGHDLINAEDLRYLRGRNPSIFYMSVLSPEGKHLFASGRSVLPLNSQELLSNLMRTCVEQGKSYVSDAYHTRSGVFLLMGFPVRRHLNDTQVSAVVVAEISLKEVGEALSRAYPLDMNALVVSGRGEIISYNGAPEGLAGAIPPEMVQKVKAIQTQLGNEHSGEVTLPNGDKILVAAASLNLPDWTVYVDQPSNVGTQLFVESTVNSFVDILVLFVVMLLFVLVVSYWVIKPITRPLERLREAAVKQREKEDFVVQAQDVEIPHNEIGELAEAFVAMSGALHERRQELIRTQTELSQSNQILEKRVEERTQELKATSKELVKAERLAAIGQMASIISHEIRNPLAVISNATRLIKMLVTSPDPKVSKQFGIIEVEIKQANSIISEVLGYARSRDLILSAIDLNSYLREILLSYPFIPGITLKEELDPESVRIKVDAEEIKQAIRNIVSNAIEAMPNGGQLTVGTKVGRHVVCIYIADQGPGLTEEVRHKMFAPFFTTKARGTGLGLAVVGKAISRHKGKLFIHSEPGKGTCFQIYLKIYRKPGDTNYGEAS